MKTEGKITNINFLKIIKKNKNKKLCQNQEEKN